MGTKTTTPVEEPMGRVGQRRQVVIPREIFDKLRMREGDLVAFRKKGNSIVVEPQRVQPQRAADADDILTAAEAKVVRRGEAQLKRGEKKSWRDVKHALAR